MTTPFDADAYLARLHWAGAAPAPTLAGVQALLAAHMRAIPFENIDVLLGRPPQLGLGPLQAKLVQARRGGYCFEHAALFGAALLHFGFGPQHHLARVVMERPREAAPLTHHVLSVQLPEGRFVLDPGLGGPAPRLPVPWGPETPAQTGDEAHTLVRDGELWVMRGQLGRQAQAEPAKDLWVARLDEAHPVDRVMGNHYTATFPESPFRQRLMLRALTAQGRITVLNQEATWRENGQVRRWTLPDRAALRALLAEHFGFDLPEVEQLRVPAVPGWCHEATVSEVPLPPAERGLKPPGSGPAPA